MNNYFESKITYLTTNALHQCAEKARLHDVNVKNYFERYLKGSRWLNLRSLLSLSLSLPLLWSALSSFLSTLLTGRLHYSPNIRSLPLFQSFRNRSRPGRDVATTLTPCPSRLGSFFSHRKRQSGRLIANYGSHLSVTCLIPFFSVIQSKLYCGHS